MIIAILLVRNVIMANVFVPMDKVTIKILKNVIIIAILLVLYA